MGAPNAKTREGHASFRDYRTWYRITGDLEGAKPPIVILHGGPGCTHDYVDSFKGLAQDGRAVVHYDQLGNGRSTHLRDKGADFWTPSSSSPSSTTCSAIWASPSAITFSASPGAGCWRPSMRCAGPRG